MVNIPEIPKSKTLGFLFFGVGLLLVSMYFNTLKDGVGNVGIWISFILIGVGIWAQLVNWYIYWKKSQYRD